MKRFKWNADKRRRALIGIEKVLMAEKPNWVLVYGDTITPKEWYNKSVKLC
jgi:UDP-N-acetylglucosamine 2-epimerase